METWSRGANSRLPLYENAGFLQVTENLENHEISFFLNLIFQAWEFMEFWKIIGPWKSWKIKVLFGSLVTSDNKARTM